jgi:hypothetical protein
MPPGARFSGKATLQVDHEAPLPLSLIIHVAKANEKRFLKKKTG